jgi:hypothetical protein
MRRKNNIMKIFIAILFLTFSLGAAETANFGKLWQDYKKDPGAAIAKYRNKVVTYNATVTVLNRANEPGKYTISLDEDHGRILLSKEEIPEDLFNYLWEYRNKGGLKLPIQFTGVWYTNRVEAFYFNKVEKITWTKPKEKKK